MLASDEDPEREALREGKGGILPPSSSNRSNSEIDVTESRANSSSDLQSATNVAPAVIIVIIVITSHVEGTFEGSPVLLSGGEVSAVRSASCCHLSGALPLGSCQTPSACDSAHVRTEDRVSVVSVCD